LTYRYLEDGVETNEEELHVGDDAVTGGAEGAPTQQGQAQAQRHKVAVFSYTKKNSISSTTRVRLHPRKSVQELDVYSLSCSEQESL
jgi:hypothetical protein